jgi:hippurate hydrolase
VELANERTPALYNDPALVRRVRAVHEEWLGTDQVRAVKPVMGGEDFSEYGRTPHRVPLCLFWLGAVDPARLRDSEGSGPALPSLHSSRFFPVLEPALRTGVTALAAAALDLFNGKRN